MFVQLIRLYNSPYLSIDIILHKGKYCSNEKKMFEEEKYKNVGTG